MKRIIIEPLEEEYQIEYLNASEFDDGLSFYSRKVLSKEETFLVGKVLHLGIQQQQLLGNGLDIIEYYIGSIESDKNINMIYNAINNCYDLPKLDATSLPVDLLIEYGKYLIKIGGSIDGLYGNTVVEIKGYANMNTPSREDLSSRYQLMIYAICLSLDGYKIIDKLERWIFNKTTNEKEVHSFVFNLEDNINLLKWRVREIIAKKI